MRGGEPRQASSMARGLRQHQLLLQHHPAPKSRPPLLTPCSPTRGSGPRAERSWSSQRQPDMRCVRPRPPRTPAPTMPGDGSTGRLLPHGKRRWTGLGPGSGHTPEPTERRLEPGWDPPACGRARRCRAAGRLLALQSSRGAERQALGAPINTPNLQK